MNERGWPVKATKEKKPPSEDRLNRLLMILLARHSNWLPFGPPFIFFPYAGSVLVLSLVT
jgi:hypothetical protein